MSAATLMTDSLTIARRNLIKIKRVPELLVFTTASPIMFILLFAYVFGGAIDPSNGGAAYREFLIVGIFAQTVVFGATITGAGLAEDVKSGIIDRFRTLPMSPSAVLSGRTFSDVVNNILVLVVMSLTGLVVGWRIHNGFVKAVLAYVLLLVFAFSISWIMAWVGLLVPPRRSSTKRRSS
jgi:ABC-type polysaccharide/polyol phosphate export permease